MRKIISVAVLIFIVLFMSSGTVYAVNIMKIDQLIENSKELDGTEVTVQGEAIGEVLERGQYAWININDGSNAIGIWMNLDDAKRVGTFGDYKHTGDIIKITGVFYKDCAQHGGDVDIHSGSMVIVKKGFEVKSNIPSAKIISALILGAIAAIFLYLYTVKLKKFNAN